MTDNEKIPRKTVALVAHDNLKKGMVEWVKWNATLLAHHHLVCTGTTGTRVEQVFRRKSKKTVPRALLHRDVQITILKSGPLGGDQQLGALIAEGKVDVMIFFWDPMQPHPHDVDVKALLRIAVLYNIPIACNRSSADFLISSPLMNQGYRPMETDFSAYVNRKEVE